MSAAHSGDNEHNVRTRMKGSIARVGGALARNERRGHEPRQGGVGRAEHRSACTSFFRLFTFLLDENGQLNYNIDITEPKAWI